MSECVYCHEGGCIGHLILDHNFRCKFIKSYKEIYRECLAKDEDLILED